LCFENENVLYKHGKIFLHVLIKIMSNEVREFQKSRKLYDVAETQHKHLNYRWTPLLILFLMLAAVGMVIAIVSFIENNNTNTDVNNIYNNIRGTYGSVKAASTAPVLGRLTLRSNVENLTRVIDGITIDIGESILLKDELNSQNNGLYTLTENGYVRSILMDKSEQVTPGNSIYVLSGTVNGGASFMLFYDSSNSFSSLNEVTGPGIIFKNSNSVLLGIEVQAPSLGFVPSYDPNEPTVLKWTSLSDLGVLPENGTGVYPANSIAVWSGVNKIDDSGAFVDPVTGEVQTPSVFLDSKLHIEPGPGVVSTLQFPDNTLGVAGQQLVIDTVLPGPVLTTKWQTPLMVQDNGNIVYVKKTLPVVAPYEYSTIQAALTYVAAQSPSATDPWQIWIYPGVYSETGLVVPGFVNVSGTSQGAVYIQGNVGSATHIVTLEDNSALYNLHIQGPTQAGFAGIYVTQADFAVQLFVVTVEQADIGILLQNGNGANVFAYLNDCAISECLSRALVVDSTVTPGETVNFYGFSTSYYASGANPITLLVEITGPDSIYNSIGEECERDPPVGPAVGTFLQITKGASARVTGLNMLYFGLGVDIPANIPPASADFTASGIDFFQCGMNIDNQNPLSVGYFAGETEFSKTVYPLNGQWYISNKNPRILTVGNNLGSDFQDVESALLSLAALLPPPDASNRFMILVAPGIFSIPATLQMLPFVTLRGVSQTDTVLQAVINIDMINVVHDSSIQNLTLLGLVGGGSNVALNFPTADEGLMTIQNVIIKGHPTGVRITDPAVSANILLSECMFMTSEETNICIDISASNLTVLNVESCIFNSSEAKLTDPFQYFLYSTSSGVLNPLIYITMTNTRLQMSLGSTIQKGTAFGLDAGTLTTVGCSVESFDTALLVTPSLRSPKIHMGNFLCENCVKDVEILNTNTEGNIAGNLARSKVNIPITANISVAYIDPASGITLSGQLFQGFNNTQSTNITRQIQQGAQLGLISGGDISVLANIVTVTPGDGYVMEGLFPSDYLKYVEWTVPQSLPLPALNYTYVYIDSTGLLTLNAAAPNLEQNILLGTVLTDGTSNQLMIQEVPKSAVHLATGLNSMLDNALGPVFVGGCIVSNVGLQLSMTLGTYYFGKLVFNPSAKALTDPFLLFYQGGALNGWNFISDTPATPGPPPPGNQEVPTQWDNSGTLTGITAGSYIKHLFYVIGDLAHQKYALVYGQQEFLSLAAATTGPLPTSPPFLIQNAVTVASIIVDSAGVISDILDERPSLSFRSGTLTSTANHSSLINLAADDHKQYLLANGTRAMSGTLQMGTNNISQLPGGTFNGVVVDDHKARHNPGGADSLAVGTPVNIGTANVQGVALSYSLSDHIHNHGAQTDPTQHAVATTLANGFMSSVDKTKLDNATPLDSLSTLMQRSATGTFQSRAHTLFDTTGAQAVTLAGATGTTPYTLTFPVDDGTANQVLTTDGSGITTWTTPTTGTVTSVGTGTGLTGGTITSTGTISFASIDPYSLWLNSSSGAAVPTNVTIGQGEIITRSGLTLVLPAGTPGQVLTSNGGGADLSWTTPTTGTVTSVGTGTGLTGGTITSTGTISFAAIAGKSLWTNPAVGSAVPIVTTLAPGDILSNDGTDLVLSPSVTAGQVLTSNGVGVPLSWSSTSSLIIPFVILYQPASGSVSEGLAAATWNLRLFDTLNNSTGSTAVTIAGTPGVPAANFTLAPGTWLMSASAPAYRVSNHMIRLEQVLPGPVTVVATGSSEVSQNSANTAQSRSILNYTFNIPTVPTTYNIRHYTRLAPGGSSLGLPISVAGINETYTTIHLLKLS
jgi:hypothetical protein